MLNKKEVISGPSFPFMEQTEEKFKMAYDSLEVQVKDDYVKIIFMQNKTPIYAYTFKKDYSNLTCALSGLKGEVELDLK